MWSTWQREAHSRSSWTRRRAGYSHRHHRWKKSGIGKYNRCSSRRRHRPSPLPTKRLRQSRPSVSVSASVLPPARGTDDVGKTAKASVKLGRCGSGEGGEVSCTCQDGRGTPRSESANFDDAKRARKVPVGAANPAATVRVVADSLVAAKRKLPNAARPRGVRAWAGSAAPPCRGGGDSRWRRPAVGHVQAVVRALPHRPRAVLAFVHQRQAGDGGGVRELRLDACQTAVCAAVRRHTERSDGQSWRAGTGAGHAKDAVRGARAADIGPP